MDTCGRGDSRGHMRPRRQRRKEEADREGRKRHEEIDIREG